MLPAEVVNGVGAVELPVPPDAAVYHNKPVPVAVNADAVASLQYTTGVVTVGAVDVPVALTVGFFVTGVGQFASKTLMI